MSSIKRGCVYFYPQDVGNVEKVRKYYKHKGSNTQCVLGKRKGLFVDNVEKSVNNLYFTGGIVDFFVDNVTNLKKQPATITGGLWGWGYSEV
ncbi:hypothetical protein M493_01550 [Geobacillus genomosp. 3]|uniref:Uncharacterized protein n=1 Tax=Geobacillus genomosp. 3 TaxID=1921421 RepID=S5YVD5_GEOG3|nr:hypothetical protein [Geobacillus genomosp. 3]AGT30654.2 hypothetical protein M493_01550 [Geobacillus genomosp. 3]